MMAAWLVVIEYRLHTGRTYWVLSVRADSLPIRPHVGALLTRCSLSAPRVRIRPRQVRCGIWMENGESVQTLVGTEFAGVTARKPVKPIKMTTLVTAVTMNHRPMMSMGICLCRADVALSPDPPSSIFSFDHG